MHNVDGDFGDGLWHCLTHITGYPDASNLPISPMTQSPAPQAQAKITERQMRESIEQERQRLSKDAVIMFYVFRLC